MYLNYLIDMLIKKQSLHYDYDKLKEYCITYIENSILNKNRVFVQFIN